MMISMMVVIFKILAVMMNSNYVLRLCLFTYYFFFMIANKHKYLVFIYLYMILKVL